MYQTLQTFALPQWWRRVMRAPTNFIYAKYSEQMRPKAQFCAIAFRSNHCRKEKNTALIPQCLCITPIDCMFSMLRQRLDCDVIPTFRSKMRVPSQDQHWYVTIYFVTSHDMHIVIQTWFVCLKCLCSRSFAGIFISNSASKPVGHGFVALHCDSTYRLSYVVETGCRLRSWIDGVSVRTDRQTLLAVCRL